jgi:hypothetical protein
MGFGAGIGAEESPGFSATPTPAAAADAQIRFTSVVTLHRQEILPLVRSGDGYALVARWNDAILA